MLSNFAEWAWDSLFPLVLGSFGYTYHSSGKVNTRIDDMQTHLATKEDLKRVEDKVERLVDHLMPPRAEK